MVRVGGQGEEEEEEEEACIPASVVVSQPGTELLRFDGAEFNKTIYR